MFIRDKTIQKDIVVILPEDAKDISCTRRYIIHDVNTFLSNYLKNLIQEIPIVETLEDYKNYIERLQKVQIRAFTWK